MLQLIANSPIFFPPQYFRLYGIYNVQCVLFTIFFIIHVHIKGGKVNVKDSHWLTPLHYAAARGFDVSPSIIHYTIHSYTCSYSENLD